MLPLWGAASSWECAQELCATFPHLVVKTKQNKKSTNATPHVAGRIASHLGFCKQDHGGTEAPGARALEDNIVRALAAPAGWKEESRGQRFPRPMRGPCDAVELRG